MNVWRDCKTSEKKCINCKGQHTLAMKLPKRKEAINQKRKEEQTQTNNTYSSALKTSNTITSNQNINQLNISAKTHENIYASVLHAHFENIGKPSTIAYRE